MSFAVDDVVRLHCVVGNRKSKCYVRILEVIDGFFIYTINPPFKVNNHGVFLGDMAYASDRAYRCVILRWKTYPTMEGAVRLWDFKHFEKVEKVSGNELRTLLQDLIVEGL